MRSSTWRELLLRSGSILHGPVLLLSLLSACSTVPFANILAVHQSQDHLYVVARSADKKDGYIKVLDANSLAVKDKVQLHKDLSQEIISVLPDDDGVIVAVREGQNRSGVYHLKAGVPVQQLGTIRSQNFLLSGSDPEFVYSLFFTEVKGRSGQVGGMRYDRDFKVKNTIHFSENPNLLVQAVAEDAEAFWYICIERRPADGAPSLGDLNGKLVVVRKTKGSKEYAQFVYEAERLRGLSSAADDKNLWIFATGDEKDSRGNYSDHKIVRFSKTERTFEARKMPLALVAFPDRGIAESEVLWALGSGNRIVRVRKQDLSYTTKPLPSSVRPHSGGSDRRLVIASTDESLLMAAYDFRNRVPASGGDMPMPHILRFSKSDMVIEMIPLKATMGEKLKTGSLNTCLGAYRGCCIEPGRKFKREEYR